MPRLHLFTRFNLRVTTTPLGLASLVGLALLSGGLAARVLQLPLGEAALAGAASGFLMFASEWLHQWGHARAAQQTGYPMTGMHFFFIFAASQYPADEPELPARIHIRRALGGWWVNVLLGAMLAPLAVYLWPGGGARAWVVVVLSVWNFFVLGLGALLPLTWPFETDGGTLARYWGKR